MMGEGEFAHHFNVEGMYNGAAGGYNALGLGKNYTKVSLEEAFDFAKKYVPINTGNNQIPELSDRFTNDFQFGY